jgi:hypothetical protein
MQLSLRLDSGSFQALVSGVTGGKYAREKDSETLTRSRLKSGWHGFAPAFHVYLLSRRRKWGRRPGVWTLEGITVLVNND